MPNPLPGTRTRTTPTASTRRLQGSPRPVFSYVELSAVPGWTEHVDLDGAPADVRAPGRGLRPRGGEPQRALRPDDRDGLAHGIKAVALGGRVRAPGS